MKIRVKNYHAQAGGVGRPHKHFVAVHCKRVSPVTPLEVIRATNCINSWSVVSRLNEMG